MFYSPECTNQDSFFKELSASFDSILSVVDKETSSALSQLVTEYKGHEAMQTLVHNLQTSPKAQYHLRSLIKELTHPTSINNSGADDDEVAIEASVGVPLEKKPAMCKYRAELIKDVTFEKKDIKVGKNEKHVKVWRLRNSGDEAWPEGCKFVALSGTADSKWITFQLSPVKANPGQVADAGFQFVTPDEVGVYEFRYALAYGENNEFMTSEPLVLTFAVPKKKEKASPCKDTKDCCEPSKPSQPPQPSPPPPPSSTKAPALAPAPPATKAKPPTIEICDDDEGDYESNVNECVSNLALMGFVYPDRNRILELMKKHSGNANAVLNEYLSSSQ